MMQPNAMYVAKECQNMATRSPNSVVFKNGATIMMGALVAATVAGVILQIYREFKPSKTTMVAREAYRRDQARADDDQAKGR
jgi:hypothetical protein